MKKLYHLIRTHLLSITRNRTAMVGSIVFPLIFIGVFGIAFQDGGGGNTSIDVGIVRGDNGVPGNAIVFGIHGQVVIENQLENQYVSILTDLTYEDTATPIFDITYYNEDQEDTALSKVQSGNLKAVLYIPDGFTLAYMAAFRDRFEGNNTLDQVTGNWTNYPNTDYQTSITIQGDQTQQQFSIVSAVIQSTLSSFTSFDEEKQDHLQAMMDTQIAVETFTVFDFIVPGLVIFGVLQNLSTSSSIAVRDIESKLLERLKITKMSGLEYTSSLIISQLIIAIIQVPIFFGTALLFGFPFQFEIAYAFIVVIIMSLSVTGLALVIASFAKDSESVGNLAAIVSVPMAFLAGAFFTVPDVTLIEEGGILGEIDLGILDLLTAKPAIEALRLIIIGGRGIADVIFELILLSLLTILYLLSGIILYSRAHLTPEN